MEKLNEYRNRIDILDQEITKLLEKRFLLSEEIGEFKKTNNIPILNLEREEAILNKIDNVFVKAVYKEIFNVSKTIQKK